MKGWLVFALLCFFTVQAQDFTGQWNGKLEVQGMQLRIVFHVSRDGTNFTAKMDSPDQGVKDIPVTTTTVSGNTIKLEIPAGAIVYEGKTIDNEHIEGTFTQAGQSLTLNLEKGIVETTIARPQDPKPPFPYTETEVTFENTKDKVTLSGTLTLPTKSSGRFPAVILISGSGPQNRNEEMLGHRPFLVLADYLTRQGIAVLRYDDRGVGKSTGDFSKSTSLDFSRDAEAALAFLLKNPAIDPKHIGLIGHSEGGIIAPMIAARSKDVDFIVLMAAPGLPGYKVSLQQQEAIARESGMSEFELQKALAVARNVFDTLVNTPDPVATRKKLTTYFLSVMKDLPNERRADTLTDEEYAKQLADEYMKPWNYQFLVYDPALALKKVKCPVLAMNGGRDLQVLAHPNLDRIKEILESNGNKNLTAIEFSNMNHLFQDCITGSPSEYGEIEQTLSPKMLERISEWILDQF